MPRDSRSSRGGFIFIPQAQFEVSWKVIVTNTDTSIETDVTNYVRSLTIEYVLGRIASCKIELSNPEGIWLNKWNGGEEVKVYGEYGDITPTNLLFNGKLDQPYFTFSSTGYGTTLECRQTPELVDQKIIEQFNNALVTDAIATIVDNNYSSIVTYTGLGESTVRFTGSFTHSSGIDAFTELADKANMDVYIDTTNNIKLFDKGSIINTDESVSYQTNLMNVSKYGKDNTKIFNRIVVYGKEDNNIILLKTEDDTASQADLWRKDLIINDTSLISMAGIQEKADTELTKNVTNVEEDGGISVLGMPKIKPGDSIDMLVPYCGIDGKQNIRGFTHTLSQSGFITSVQIKDKQISITDIFRERINTEDQLKSYNNLNSMTDSYTIFFNELPEIVTHSNTEIVEGRLQLKSGKVDGSTVFGTLTADHNIIQCELRLSVNAPQHEECEYNVSNNGGASYEPTTPGTLHTFASSGNLLSLSIKLKGSSTSRPSFDSVCVLFKAPV